MNNVNFVEFFRHLKLIQWEETLNHFTKKFYKKGHQNKNTYIKIWYGIFLSESSEIMKERTIYFDDTLNGTEEKVVK